MIPEDLSVLHHFRAQSLLSVYIHTLSLLEYGHGLVVLENLRPDSREMYKMRLSHSSLPDGFSSIVPAQIQPKAEGLFYPAARGVV